MTWPAKLGEWTTQEEGYPPIGETVILALVRSGELTSGYYVGERFGLNQFPFTESGRDGWHFRAQEVLAWMPMPAAPSASHGHDSGHGGL